VKPSKALALHRAEILRVVDENHACNPRVFGSLLFGLDTEYSDLDILIDTTFSTTLMNVATIQVELERMLGVSVDVHTPKSLPDEFRLKVITESQPI